MQPNAFPQPPRHKPYRRPVIWVLVGVVMLALTVLGCLAANANPSASAPQAAGAPPPRAADAPLVNSARPPVPAEPAGVRTGEEPAQRLTVQVLASAPHDRGAFTQGLVWYEGALYESTGLYGQSTVREVDRTTGEVRRQVPLDPTVFAEGLAQFDSRLIQITWQQGVAFVYDLATFERLDQLTYTGEGWGLCNDGTRLVMSDGSSNLTFRDPQTFAAIGTVGVTLDGRPIDRLNELECVGDRVYANIWMTDLIVRIDPSTGRVDAAIDAANLLAPQERFGADVLNGIAYDPEQDVFLITGKLWPRLFEVRFIPPA
jgi:glutaminyl-peptide cyclotransferase